MKLRHALAVAALAALAVPEFALAQRAGSIELGALGRFTAFDNDVGVDNALGGGGRLGVFVFQNLSVEADWSYAEPDLATPATFRGEEITWVSHELITGRLLYNYPLSEEMSLLLGGGYSYDNFTRIRPTGIAERGGGPAGLLGIRYSFADRFSFRAEGVGHYVSDDPNPLNLGVQVGLSAMFRHEVETEVVEAPAPPPDTVVVEREVEPELPTGEPANLCLATGEQVEILITAQGDSLVGPERTNVRELRPGVVFAGTYAEGRGWFDQDEAIEFEDNEYLKSGGEVGLNCPDIMQVGEYQGVPLFADVGADRPFESVYVPVRPGVWQAYETGLPEVRG